MAILPLTSVSAEPYHANEVGVKIDVPKQLKPIEPVKAVEQAPLAPAPVPAPTPTPTPVAPPPASSGCGDNEYAHFIYMHESGCSTTALNSIGCYGIGQACPASKIAYCGSDYACQNEFFTQYANSRYGGWAGAYQAWLAQGWW